jgi:PLP dependent protein
MTNTIQTSWSTIAPNATVVAITKTFPFDAVATAYAMGLRHIGENRVEEAMGKIEEAKQKGFSGLIWHMVGHVQSIKIVEVVRNFDWIDSIDSIELLKKINAEATRINKKLHVLLEVNLSGEKTKYGFDLAGWEKDTQKLQNSPMLQYIDLGLTNVLVEGLMTMAPYVSDAEKNRSIFQSMKQLSKTIRTQIPAFGSELSMGTSVDYKVALEEGATQVRLGEALFGERIVAK